jgi:hypothetical protein
MRYCPTCLAEYRDDVPACTDCGVPLVDVEKFQQISTARMREDAEQFVPVKTVEDQFSGEVIRDALEKEGIPVLVRSFSDTPFDGIFIPQNGWGLILVPGEFKHQAENIIELLD